MSILTNVKSYLTQKAVSAGTQIGDGIATVSALAPKQLQETEEKRIAYLSAKPDMNGKEAQTFIQRNLGTIGIEVYQAYFEQLNHIYQPMDETVSGFDEENRIRFFDITKWVTDKEERSLDKLVNVYHVLSEEDCNIALIYHRTKVGCQITLGIANCDENHSDPAIADNYQSRIISAIQGNFPGVEIKIEDNSGSGVPDSLATIDINEKRAKSVAIVSNIPSEKSEDYISQSMEKLLDGFVPKKDSEEYTVVLLAKPIRDQLERKNRLYALYTVMSPYSNWQTGYTFIESEGVASSASAGVNLGISAGGHGGFNETSGISESHSETQGSSKSSGWSITPFGIGFNGGQGQSKGSTDTFGIFESSGNNAGIHAAANFGVSFSRSSSVMVQAGKTESITQNYTNYAVKHTLELIESQVKRIEESTALGMWEFSSYFISDSPVIANNVAHMYLSLTQGEMSYLTNTTICLWDGRKDRDAARAILKSVSNLQHPVFGLKPSYQEEWLMYPVLVTPTTPLSGKELAKALNFPRKSISGLPILEFASFGREIVYTESHHTAKNKGVEIGKIYHMGREEDVSVHLDTDTLTSHTFITGSTGSGKSNTIYKMIECLSQQHNNITWLVIEPAKGEYKAVLGGCADVTVYGTNPYKVPKLLGINPFSFPDDVHVLEHVDRLVEIFNTCWPMYAAMPAILRESMERAYEECGWNLKTSKNPGKFPTFETILEVLPQVIDSSKYSADTTNDYKGALVTRVRSLTRGIHGLIFSEDTDAKELFDNNAIVDLSRIGSQETKSLIMGILVLKLQEHRMANAEEPNNALRHVTVLEEAHHLLRRTSNDQSQESANLIGQAVAMLANSIAEMRTYGEGFIIADQSPGLMDMSVVRNTNTKIILRLPDEGDRELVGRAAGLNDAQIEELAFLERGVAAIYQSDWAEAVLAKVTKFESAKPLKVPENGFVWQDKETETIKKFLNVAMNIERKDFNPEEVERLHKWCKELNLSGIAEKTLGKVLRGNRLNDSEKALMLYHIAGKKAMRLSKKEAIEHAADILPGRFGVAEDSGILEVIRDVLNKELSDDSKTEKVNNKVTKGVIA